jgi:hypothetical protein
MFWLFNLEDFLFPCPSFVSSTHFSPVSSLFLAFCQALVSNSHKHWNRLFPCGQSIDRLLTCGAVLFGGALGREAVLFGGALGRDVVLFGGALG